MLSFNWHVCLFASFQCQFSFLKEAQVAQPVDPPVMAEAEDPPAPAEAVEAVIEKVVVANGGIVAVVSVCDFCSDADNEMPFPIVTVEEQIPAQPDTTVADVEAAPVPTAAAGEVESPAPDKPLTLRYSYKDGSCLSWPLC